MTETEKLKQMTALLKKKLLILETEIFKDWPTDSIGRMAHGGLMVNRSLNLNYLGRMLYNDASLNLNFNGTKMTDCDISGVWLEQSSDWRFKG